MQEFNTINFKLNFKKNDYLQFNLELFIDAIFHSPKMIQYFKLKKKIF